VTDLPLAHDELDAQVRHARTRMLFSHVPLASLVAAVFAVLMVALVEHMHPGGDKRSALVWMICTLLVALLRTHHALAYFQSTERHLPGWQRGMCIYTGLFAVCWGLAVWMLPVNGRTDLQAVVLGSVAGMAASGALMLTADRLSARLWIGPILLSGVSFSASLGNDYGAFGMVSLAGFAVILWVESGRAHRRLGELLHLRFQSDQIVAARTQALEAAEQSNLAKGQFLAAMSHEMRTPLHGMIGLSRMLRPELQSQEAHQRLNLLQGAGQNLLNVINDVLDFARLQSGKLDFTPQTVALHELVRDLAAAAEVSAMDKGVSVHMENHLPDDVWVDVDAARLRQVLNNLMTNAVKFTERGHITVRLMRTATQPDPDVRWFQIEVEDTGIGIPQGDLPRIFEAFHQAESSHNRRSPGSGLGLSIASQVCRAMGGELRAQSQQGVGSLFRCSLPLRVVDAPAIALPQVPVGAMATWPPQSETRSPLHGLVLLVEDNPVNAMVAQAELEQVGLNVATVENGRQAIEWLALHEADLVLMDCHMPEMDGFEATRHIREVEAHRGDLHLPIIALTASAQVEDQRACLEAGMDDHLAKPFTQGELVRVIRRHLLRSGRKTTAALLLRERKPEQSTLA
jgi:signal transduction histidine kinase/FixJ family two-component response regulator